MRRAHHYNLDDVGQRGERRVRLWLRLRGYRILTSNFTARGGELDIVALRGRTLHIVEVKTRSRGSPGRPGDALTPGKRLRILNATRCYLRTCRARYARVSFDLAEVVLPRRLRAVRMTLDAFRADEVPGWGGTLPS